MNLTGLTYLGEGNFRTAYLDAENGLVYKVENEDGRFFNCNEREFYNYNLSLDLPANVQMPHTVLRVDNVIVMDYIKGTPMGECSCVPGNLEPDHDKVCLPDYLTERLEAMDFDLAFGNVVFDGYTYWIVDFDSELG